MSKRKYRQQDNLVKLIREEEQGYVKNVRPITPAQADFLSAIDSHTVAIGAGPAGTGKTYLACIKAVEGLKAQDYNRIIITRPALSAGSENLGFLPGSIENKLDPFLRPCMQVLGERMGQQKVKKYLQEGVIEFVSFAHMRGRTFHNAFIIADEVQNVSVDGMKMLLTRIGFNSKMVLCGDVTQSDLPKGEINGLADAIQRFKSLEHVGITEFSDKDVVRSEVVSELLSCY